MDCILVSLFLKFGDKYLLPGGIFMGKVYGYERVIAMAAGLAIAFVISMLTEVFTYMYYESKN